MPTDPATPLAPDQPDTDNIIRAVFAHGYQRAMTDASRLVDTFSTRVGDALALEIRVALVEAGLDGTKVHDAIMRMNTPPAPHGGGTSQDASGG